MELFFSVFVTLTFLLIKSLCLSKNKKKNPGYVCKEFQKLKIRKFEKGGEAYRHLTIQPFGSQHALNNLTTIWTSVPFVFLQKHPKGYIFGIPILPSLSATPTSMPRNFTFKTENLSTDWSLDTWISSLLLHTPWWPKPSNFGRDSNIYARLKEMRHKDDHTI